MAQKSPFVLLDSNKIGLLGEGDTLNGVPSGSDAREVDFLLGDASASTSSGSWDHVIEFDNTEISSLRVSSIRIVAPQQQQFSATSTTTAQVSTDITYATNQDSISLGSSERSKNKAVSIDVDVEGGEKLYIRFYAAGGHNQVHFHLIYKVTGVPE